MLVNNVFGIDLGTNNIKIYNKSDDSIMVEKNMIAIENKSTLFAYGNSAFDMYEKAPSNIHISYPLCNGVIADIKNMETIVRYFIQDLMKGSIKPADYYIAVPTDVTEVEKRAFYDLIKDANVKAKKYFYVMRPVLACRWILEKGTPPPMRFTELMAAELPGELHPEMEHLLELKMNAPEIKEIPRINVLNEYLDTSITEIKNLLLDMDDTKKMEWEILNQMFLEAL